MRTGEVVEPGGSTGLGAGVDSVGSRVGSGVEVVGSGVGSGVSVGKGVAGSSMGDRVFSSTGDGGRVTSGVGSSVLSVPASTNINGELDVVAMRAAMMADRIGR